MILKASRVLSVSPQRIVIRGRFARTLLAVNAYPILSAERDTFAKKVAAFLGAKSTHNASTAYAINPQTNVWTALKTRSVQMEHAFAKATSATNAKHL